MAYPSGVQLATLTFSNPITHLGNAADRTEVTIEPSAGVVWAATGQPIDDFSEVVSPGAGLPGSLTAPFVDQSGFTDGAGNSFTMWAYTVTRVTWLGSSVKRLRKAWQPVLGQTTVDFDLLPGGSIGLPVSAPIPPVTSVAGEVGAVGASALVTALGLGNVNNTTDAGKPVSTAQATAIALKQNTASLDADVTAKATTGGTALNTALNATYAHRASVLAPWRRKLKESPATAKIALVGDSTRDTAAAGLLFHNSLKFHIAQGRYLEGMDTANVLNFGFNGATIEVITNTSNMAALAAAAPNLVEVSMGINNIRATALTTSQLETTLAAGIAAIRAAVPGVPIIGTIPNSFLTTDVGASGYVSPNSEAAAKSVILRAAWLRMTDRWPDVLIRDAQETIFGTVSPATSPYMTEQLHPSTAGTDASAAELAAMIGSIIPYVPALAVAARTATPFTPWTAYGREVEDLTRYFLVASGEHAAQGSNFVRFKYPPGRKANIQARDILELPDGTSFILKEGFGTNANGVYTDLTLASGETVPANGTTNGDVKIWRRRYSGDSVFNDAAADTTIKYRRIGRIHTAGAGFFRAAVITLGDTPPGTAVDAALWNTTTVSGDKLYVEGYGSNPITLTGGGASNQGWELSTAGDWSGYVGRLVMITSTAHS